MLTRLADGTRVVIREIRPADKAMLARGHSLLSEESQRRRFLGAKPRLSASELRYLTEVDGRRHFALVAVSAERLDHILGVARFVRLDDGDTVDAAIVVGDPWQGRGLGKRLALALADAARERGVRRFEATMLSDNPAALALMRTLSARLETGGHEAGVREVSGELAA